MPDFGPAHELLGFFGMVQGENLPAAEQQLRLAIQLEPENSSYLLTLAQAQLWDRPRSAARHTSLSNPLKSKWHAPFLKREWLLVKAKVAV